VHEASLAARGKLPAGKRTRNPEPSGPPRTSPAN